MKINSLPSWQIAEKSLKGKEVETAISFQDFFKDALHNVNQMQLEADKKSIDFALGGVNAPDIHQVMISMEKASLALNLTIEIRNKLVESYQELMRMQV